MSLYTRLVSGLVFPLQERLKHHDTLRVRGEIEHSQFWPLEKPEAFQEGR